MNLLERVVECKEEEIDTIMKQAIEEADAKSDKVEKLGFLNDGKSNLFLRALFL